MDNVMENKNSNRATSIRWHKLLGRMLEELLTPLNITVLTDISVMTDPPEADILLIRRDLPKWTDDQLCRLPDGIRDTDANHILVEFKFTESFNRNLDSCKFSSKIRVLKQYKLVIIFNKLSSFFIFV